MKNIIKNFKRLTIFVFALYGLIFINNQAVACTAIKLNYKNQYVAGQNFDWTNKHAFIVISPVGIERQEEDLKNNGQALKWISKYGSATINLTDKNNQLDLAAVPGGINQFGLSAAVLWLSSSKFPQNMNQPELGSAEWVQYLLDNAKTVAEAIKLAQAIEIEPSVYDKQKILAHLFVHDAMGHSAVMEYLNGKLVVYQGKDLPVPVLANDPYEKSIQSLKKYKNFGGNLPLPGGYFSTERFVLAANFLKTLPEVTSQKQAIALTFNALGYLSQIPSSPSPTVWSAVYDLSNRTLYYRNIDNPQIRFVRLSDFNLTAGQPVRALSINNDLSGNLKNYFHPIVR